jgi:predicted outer membrane repeat protein
VGESTIESTTITGNSAVDGGGMMVGDARLTITDSTISNNSTTSFFGGVGGGIWSSYAQLTILRSVITGNSAGYGGGIFAYSDRPTPLTLVETTISNNSADGDGGGILSRGLDITALGSTISGNSAGGVGGGIGFLRDQFERARVISLVNSTVSGNRSGQNGGGIYFDGDARPNAISHSTIAFNMAGSAAFDSGSGGGLFVRRGSLEIDHSIIARNLDRSEVGPDVTGFLGATLIVTNSLIGTNTGSGLAQAPVGSPDANGNLIGGPGVQIIDPLLGPLVDYLGPTPFHPLTGGSPAINVGDPAALVGVDGVPRSDQRGAPYKRIYGRIDIGAFEVQPIPLAGDYNYSGIVETADVIIWRKTLGSTTDLRADGNNDGVVDQADWNVWRENYGRTTSLDDLGAEGGPPPASAYQARSGEPDAIVALPPHRPAWQPAVNEPTGRTSQAVPVEPSRPLFRPPTQRLAPDEDLLDMLASPRATTAGRQGFTPLGRQAMRDMRLELANQSVETIDRVFETLGSVASTLRVP